VGRLNIARIKTEWDYSEKNHALPYLKEDDMDSLFEELGGYMARVASLKRLLQVEVKKTIREQEENVRLRGALTFYANEKHYQDYDEWSPGTSDVMSDHGRKAKSALEETK
jgi:hypothetical protein